MRLIDPSLLMQAVDFRSSHNMNIPQAVKVSTRTIIITHQIKVLDLIRSTTTIHNSF